MGLLIAPLRLPLCTTNTTKKEYDRHFGVYILNNHTKLKLHYTYNRWPYDCFVSIKRKQRGDGQDNGLDPLCCAVCVAMAGALCFVFVLFFSSFLQSKTLDNSQLCAVVFCRGRFCDWHWYRTLWLRFFRSFSGICKKNWVQDLQINA